LLDKAEAAQSTRQSRSALSRIISILNDQCKSKRMAIPLDQSNDLICQVASLMDNISPNLTGLSVSVPILE